MSHAGYPWVLEAVLLAWKYEHVYLELAAHRPRYLAEAGTGWESPPPLRPVDDRRQGPLRNGLVPPRPTAGRDRRGVPCAAGEARGDGTLALGNAEQLLGGDTGATR
jgi:hypothetical protein